MEDPRLQPDSCRHSAVTDCEEPDLSTTIATTMIFITLLFVAGLSYKIVAGGSRHWEFRQVSSESF